MVTIEPFFYQKTTAFKERMELVSKLNEIITIFNEVDIEGKIDIFNEEIEIINGKITQVNNALIEVNDAVETVEGYDGRLTTVETLSGNNKSRLDSLEPRVTANETLSGNNKSRLDSLEPRVSNTETEINKIENLNSTFNGIKSFEQGINGYFNDWKGMNITSVNINDIKLIARLNWGNGKYYYFESTETSNTAMFKCDFGVHIFGANSYILGLFINKGFGANNPSSNDAYVLAKDENDNFYLGIRRKVQYGGIAIRVKTILNYGSLMPYSSNAIEWLDEPIVIEGGTSPDYTIIEAQY